eukprot:NODE_272_length_12196_cov_0.228404.p9 type:complete len:121 gc:universal NODE_272_length_12196_cov_0.228404:10608-10970(+)
MRSSVSKLITLLCDRDNLKIHQSKEWEILYQTMADSLDQKSIEKVIHYYHEKMELAKWYVSACKLQMEKIENFYVQDNNIRLEHTLDRIYKNNQECRNFFLEYISKASAKLEDMRHLKVL